MEHPIPDLAASTSDDDTDTDNCNDATTEQQSTSSISSLALVLHGLTSMAILYYFTSSLPPHPHQLETHQIQLLGTVLIAFLSIHAIVYFYLAAATAPPHRRPSPSLSSTSTPHDATPSVRLLESVEALNGTWIRGNAYYLAIISNVEPHQPTYLQQTKKLRTQWTQCAT